MKNSFFKYLNFKLLTEEIRGYGYHYSFKNFLLTFLGCCFFIVSCSYFYMLKVPYILFIILATLFILPGVTIAQYRHLYNNNRFEQLRHYLEYMILSFRATPKISQALKEVEELVEGEMKDLVNVALKRLEEYPSGDLYDYALQPIEKAFPNSRLLSLHRFMKTIERQSSKNFHNTMDNLRFDISQWITRAYIYQSELKTQKMRINVAIAICLIISIIFSYLYQQHGTIGSFTSSAAYQVITTIYVLIMFGIYSTCEAKLHGQWVINDMTNEKEKKAVKDARFLQRFNPLKTKKQKIIISVLLELIGLLLWFIQKRFSYVIFSTGFVLLLNFQHRITYRSKMRRIKKSIEKEFPIWLREVALMLNERIVPDAIRETSSYASNVIKPYIQTFLRQLEDDPVSIRPYLAFLEEYHIDEITDAMKTLYSIQRVSSHNDRQINDLVVRNQQMLEKAERIHNEDSIAVVAFLTNIPSFVFSMKLIFDMLLMLVTVISTMRGMV